VIRCLGPARRRAFSFVELLIGLIFLSLVLLSLMWMNSSSNRGAMDAYYEMLAFSLAREPIEIFRGFGYDWARTYPAHPLPDFPVAEWRPVLIDPNALYPVEAGSFQRFLELEPVERNGVRAMRVRVRVSPLGATWMSRPEIALDALITEQPLP